MNGVNTNRVVHRWNAKDTIGYECPITELVKRTTTQVIEERGERIYQAVLDIDVHVDKEELLKALQYDRGQYEKGYRDCQRDGRRWNLCSEHLPIIEGFYLTTTRAGYVTITHFNTDTMQWAYGINTYILAWMPLPAPYREGDV